MKEASNGFGIVDGHRVEKGITVQLYLPIRSPRRAQLAVTVCDEVVQRQASGGWMVAGPPRLTRSRKSSNAAMQARSR